MFESLTQKYKWTCREKRLKDWNMCRTGSWDWLQVRVESRAHGQDWEQEEDKNRIQFSTNLPACVKQIYGVLDQILSFLELGCGGLLAFKQKWFGDRGGRREDSMIGVLPTKSRSRVVKACMRLQLEPVTGRVQLLCLYSRKKAGCRSKAKPYHVQSCPKEEVHELLQTEAARHIFARTLILSYLEDPDNFLTSPWTSFTNKMIPPCPEAGGLSQGGILQGCLELFKRAIQQEARISPGFI